LHCGFINCDVKGQRSENEDEQGYGKIILLYHLLASKYKTLKKALQEDD
jgi:hypothetical protein